MKKENDFNNAKIKLKCTCSYMVANHTDKEFIKDGNNFVENWDFHISNYKNEDKSNFIWFTLIARNKDNQNITQIDFDEISKNDLSNLIKDLVDLYKTL